MIDTTALPATDTGLMAAAQDLSAAKARYEAAIAAVSATLAESDARRSRLAALDGKRAAIAARRRHGQQSESDGTDLALIAMDREGLEPLVAEADASVGSARAEAAAAAQAMATANRAFQRREDELYEKALIEHARQLDAALCQTAAELDEVGRRLGRREPPWGASGRLTETLSHLRFLRHE